MKDDMFSFEINSQNSILNHIYKHEDNIRIIDGMADNNKCIIICSSNGIFFPNTYEEFRTKIICNNYFEGGRLSSFLVEHVKRIILLRDIRKNFYVTGINEKYNSIDSILNLLRKITKGYEIITAGSSAGGYMASIIGSCLNVSYIINIGGQWNLYEYNNVLEKYYFLNKNKDNIICNKWFNLNVKLSVNHVPILYIYSALNQMDVKQLECAKNIDNLYPIAIKSKIHAQGISTGAYLRLLCATREDILRICRRNEGYLLEKDIFDEQINVLLGNPARLGLHCIKNNERKQEAYLELLYEWIKAILDKSLVERRCDYNLVAIWGKGKYCSLLLSDLKKQNINVKCIVETQPLDLKYEGIPIVKIDDLPNDVDTIIIVPYYDIEEIKEKANRHCVGVKIIGIDEYIKTRFYKKYKKKK